MIQKWYEVSCDICGYGLNHYAGLKPTPTDLRRDGIKVKSITVKPSLTARNVTKN